MRKPAVFKAVAPYVAALAVLILAGLLLAVIYLTEFNLLWVAFLTGVLAAAVLSLVSRASKAEWIISRREAKITSLQEKLTQEIRLRRQLEFKLADLQQQNIAAGLDVPAPAELPAAENGNASSAAQDMFVQSLSEQMAGPNDAVNRILSAIEHNEFRLYCQRIASLHTGSAQNDHYEILIRLIEEEEGLMPPGAFFPLVEKYGLMPQLDRWVVRNVIKWLAAPAATPSRSGSTFFINISTESLVDLGFPEFVSDQLQRHNIAGRALCFEITETELSHSHDEVILFAKAVQSCGCMVAICNFGRNGVTFEPLYKVRADFLKVDGSIVLDILRDPADLAQVAAIARVAKTIDIKTIAELVESDACMAKLREIGVDYAQGFGISVPVSLESLA